MVKFSVIGASGIADRRAIPAILKSDKCKLVALMDRNEEKAKALGEKYGVPYFISEQAMLDGVDCDAVYIGTPVALHFEQAMTSLKANKHVFLEKPITMDGQSAKDLVEAFKCANKQLTVGYMMKYHNLHVKARRMIKAQKIGKVVNVRAQFSCWYPEIEGAWRQNKALGGGGAIMDLGAHCIELIEYVLQEKIVKTKSIMATNTFSYEVEDSGVIVFQTDKGTLGNIEVNFNVPDNASLSKLEIYGTKGYVQCFGTLGQQEDGYMSYLYAPQGEYSALQDRTTFKPKKFKGKGNDLYQKQLEDFCKIIESGKPKLKYAYKAVEVQKIIDDIYQQNK